MRIEAREKNVKLFVCPQDPFTANFPPKTKPQTSIVIVLIVLVIITSSSYLTL